MYINLSPAQAGLLYKLLRVQGDDDSLKLSEDILSSVADWFHLLSQDARQDSLSDLWLSRWLNEWGTTD